MRARETHINVRTTQKEKAHFERNARQCGLSLSEYLRKLASGYEPKALPPLDYGKLMRLITNLYIDFNETGQDQYAKLLINVLLEMQEAIAPGKNPQVT